MARAKIVIRVGERHTKVKVKNITIQDLYEARNAITDQIHDFEIENVKKLLDDIGTINEEILKGK